MINADRLIGDFSKTNMHSHPGAQDKLDMPGHIVVDEDAWREWLALRRTATAYLIEQAAARMGDFHE